MPERDYIQKQAKFYHEPKIRDAFHDGIDKVARKIKVEDLAAGLEYGSSEGAVSQIEIDLEDFEPMRAATAAGVGAGGKETVKALPAVMRKGQRVKISFDPGSRRAVAAVDNLHTSKIREVRNSTREAIRNHLRHGLEFGKNPRTIAREIRGRYDYAAKRYRGGIIGLTEHQEGWVANAERQLRSGDPKEMRRYLGRKLRDRRHDRTILKAINEGTPIPEKTVQDATYSYRRRAIAYRAETIARDQSLSALSLGQDLALDQNIDGGAFNERDVLQLWVHSGDARVRDTHAAVPAMNPGGVRRGDFFETPLGPLKRPRDQNSPGSVRENVIQCRCSLSIRIRRV